MLGSLSLVAVARASNVYLQEPGARRARSEQEGGGGGRRRRRRLRLRQGGGRRSGRRRSIHHHPLSPDRWGWSDLEGEWGNAGGGESSFVVCHHPASKLSLFSLLLIAAILS